MFYYFQDKLKLLEGKLEVKEHKYMFSSYKMELYSAYAQCAIKLFRVCSAWIVHVKMFAFYRWLSMRGNSFLVCSACDEIDSAYAQHVIKLFPRMLSIRMQ